jgi:hypothetical protein
MSEIRAGTTSTTALVTTGDTTGNIVLTPDSGIATINATGGLTLPSGTTAQRPASLVAGQMRFNTTNSRMEYYSGNAWVTLGISSAYYANLASAQSAGLVQFWSGNSSTTIVSNLTGTAVGSPTVNNTGSFGGGSYPYINCQGGTTATGYSYSGYTASGNNSLTMMMWVSQASTIDTETTFLQLGTFSSGNAGCIFAFGVNSSRQLRVIGIARDTTASSAATLTANTFTHIAAVYDGASSITFYINGVAVLTASTGGSMAIGNFGTAMHFGYGNWNASTTNKYSNSFISDAAVFNTALTSTVINGIYTSGRLIVGY